MGLCHFCNFGDSLELVKWDFFLTWLRPRRVLQITDPGISGSFQGIDSSKFRSIPCLHLTINDSLALGSEFLLFPELAFPRRLAAWFLEMWIPLSSAMNGRTIFLFFCREEKKKGSVIFNSQHNVPLINVYCNHHRIHSCLLTMEPNELNRLSKNSSPSSTQRYMLVFRTLIS